MIDIIQNGVALGPHIGGQVIGINICCYFDIGMPQTPLNVNQRCPVLQQHSGMRMSQRMKIKLRKIQLMMNH